MIIVKLSFRIENACYRTAWWDSIHAESNVVIMEENLMKQLPCNPWARTHCTSALLSARNLAEFGAEQLQNYSAVQIALNQDFFSA